MRCPNCNAEIPEGQSFCSNCNSEVRAKDAFHLDFAPSQEMIDKIIESPHEGVRVWDEKTNATLFDKVKEADRIITKAYAHFDKAIPILQYYSSKKTKWIKWFVLFLVACALLLYINIKYKTGEMGIAGWGISMSFVGVFWCVACGLLIKDVIISVSAVSNCKIATKEKLEGIHILQAHEYNLRFLPEEYLNPLATGFLVKIIATGRAKDLNDALDRCDAYLRHTELQSQLQSMNDNINYLRAEVGSLNRSVDFWGALNFYK